MNEVRFPEKPKYDFTNEQLTERNKILTKEIWTRKNSNCRF